MQSQVRLLGLSLLVGLVAGLAAVVFYVATVAAEHYLLGIDRRLSSPSRTRRRNSAALAAADHDAVSPLAAVGHSAASAGCSPAGSFTRSLPKPKGTGPMR